MNLRRRLFIIQEVNIIIRGENGNVGQIYN